MEFEKKTKVSLAISANVLHALDHDVRVGELPGRTGVSKEAVAMAMKVMERGGLVSVERDGRWRVARPTDEGRTVRDACERRGAEEERQTDLRAAMIKGARLFEGLQAGGWRTSAPKTLPRFPMVLHRGGFPDGS